MRGKEYAELMIVQSESVSVRLSGPIPLRRGQTGSAAVIDSVAYRRDHRPRARSPTDRTHTRQATIDDLQ